MRRPSRLPGRGEGDGNPLQNTRLDRRMKLCSRVILASIRKSVDNLLDLWTLRFEFSREIFNPLSPERVKNTYNIILRY